MKEKFNKFMYGRYGNDELNQFLFKLVIGSLIISLFTRSVRYISDIFYYISMCLALSVYFRIFSKNLSKRYQERNSFLDYSSKFKAKQEKRKRQQAQKNHMHFLNVLHVNKR